MDRKLVLENGVEFTGKGFGADKEAVAELVFNTSMVGYQEILSDPSYTDQLVIMTYPLIGNYGIIDEDYESRLIGPKGFIVREYNDKPSNFRYTKTLNELLIENDIPGISHIDTRKLTRILRDEGSMLGILCAPETSTEEALEKIKAYEIPNNQVSKVSCKKKWYSRCANPKYNVVAIDCGIKYNIIRELNRNGCNVTIVPFNTPVEKILEIDPDGIFLSNGPGDPENVTEVIETVKALQGKKPIFGICLGHQMIALANGLKTYKLKFGHRGANHPVKNLVTGKVEITSQNHSYAVSNEGIENSGVEVTHINLLDNTIEGLKIEKDKVFSTQYHPESAAGPEDSKYLFSLFIANMEENRKEAA
ncbi:MAG: glutamine-hydrolyzing carbamoyl-phosphate synthase small subunit [Erysipelotrichaceae bacterium]|nr:glutamine-hydrolyzing carbamoyl-phosphate synthase small subunit [Erysipelotrichaceae bacterium]